MELKIYNRSIIVKKYTCKCVVFLENSAVQRKISLARLLGNSVENKLWKEIVFLLMAEEEKVFSHIAWWHFKYMD